MKLLFFLLFLLAPSVPVEAQTITQTNHHTFWNSAFTNRIADRLFVGGAVDNDGAYLPSGCTGCNWRFTDLDWLGHLGAVHFNGGDTVQQNCDFAQLCVLGDPAATVGDTPLNVPDYGTPLQGVMAGVTTKGMKSDGSPRALESSGINDPSPGKHPAVWSWYGEAHRLSNDAGNTFGAEIEARDSTTNGPTNWTPSSTSGVGAAIGMAIGCGAGLSGAGQGPCGPAMYVTKNPKQFSTGLLFFRDAVGPYGVGGTSPYIQLPTPGSIEWWDANNGRPGIIRVLDGGQMQLLTSGLAITGLAPSGTPAGSLCIQSNGVVYIHIGGNCY